MMMLMDFFFFCRILHYNILKSEVELGQASVEVGVGEPKVIVCIASVTSCCKFVGRLFISLGYLSKLISEKKNIIYL